MNKISLIIASLLLTISASAGDGGFFLQTCVSESSRTNLTIYNDNFSGAKVPNKVVFGIDGQFVTYAPEEGQCQDIDGQSIEDECLSVSTAPHVFVNQGEAGLLLVTFGDSMTASVHKGFYDPRSKQMVTKVGPILLTCKEFYQEP